MGTGYFVCTEQDGSNAMSWPDAVWSDFAGAAAPPRPLSADRFISCLPSEAGRLLERASERRWETALAELARPAMAGGEDRLKFGSAQL